ncbi:hypothetical protein AU210_007993 [Fusarium oxysporum f. sp. radicis-cucumerinum]|uniref:DUF202 domain-containing protein n=40 Tax=Fusarium TaxID=5506 RepID=A0A2H3HCD8_FUSOX|nr:hypothetical protein AU210_007993 [Fusarium oxysporum f. sp. radicis-cucumerinum]
MLRAREKHFEVIRQSLALGLPIDHHLIPSQERPVLLLLGSAPPPSFANGFTTLATGAVNNKTSPISSNSDMSSQPLLQTTPGKRIALPTRVEPKVFFANERTFLSWLNFTVILGALAIGMLNFGDRVAFISAFLFTGVAMLTMIYALVTYHWRAKSIRMKGQAGFDDRFGPTVLAIILLLAVIVNFVLRITDKSKNNGN